MYVGKTLFAQIMEFVPWTSFGRIVDRYGGNSGVRRLSCAEQFRVMAFAQLTWRESLRDIEVTLGANANKLYAMGLRNTVRRSTLVKLHTLLDLRGAISAFIHISDGKLHEVNVLDFVPTEPGAFYVMDRRYLDFGRLYAMNLTGAFFVTRAKTNMNAKRVYLQRTDRSTGVICDQSLQLNGFYASQHYPENLHRIRFKDPETEKDSHLLDQQFCSAPADNRSALQESLAGRIVLQVDQTAPSHEEVFGQQRERSQDANLVRRVDLRSDCYRQKGTSN